MLNSWSFSRNSAGQKKWQDIFKVLKGKNLQPRLLYPAIIDGEISPKVKRIQYHQTSFTTNVKGTSTVKKYKRRKKIYTINPKQLRTWHRNIYSNNYFKCKWIKCSNQKMQTGWKDTKTRPKYTLSSRNPLQT